MASTSDDGSVFSSPPPLPPPHIIHSPLPSRPSPTQPAHVLDALLRGSHADSAASPAPTAESSTTSFSAHGHHAPMPMPTSHSSTPQSFSHLQPAQAPPDRSIDLLAMLTNASNASQSQLLMPQLAQPLLQPHPQPPRLPVDDPKMAGRMILDSLLKYVPFSLPDPSRPRVAYRQTRNTRFFTCSLRRWHPTQRVLLPGGTLYNPQRSY